ncbi:MAG: hypothetical protein J6V72_21835 [Kiritimatiellae bacterium]|nr:hypothetical protein [Kiritimatiellia bacterium]
MIGQMAVRVTADRANFPLGTLFIRAGSAANVAILGIPVRAGVDVEAVTLRVENVDGATADFAARAFGGVWVVDLPASHLATVGGVTGGVSVWATGTGADGETARTWCVGVGDLEVLTADADAPAPAPGQTFWPLRMFDAAPATPTKYNAYLDGGALKIWNGTAWVSISGGSIDVDDEVTRTSANAVKSSGIWGAIWGALTALPTGVASLYDWCVAQLAGMRGKTDLAVYGEASAWRVAVDGAEFAELAQTDSSTWQSPDGNVVLRRLASMWLFSVSPSGAAGTSTAGADADALEIAGSDGRGYAFVRSAGVVPTGDALAKTSELAGKMEKTVPDVYSFAWGADLGGDGMAVKIPSAGGTTKDYVFDDGVSENLNAVMRRSDMAGAVAEFLPYSLVAPEPSGASLPAGVTAWVDGSPRDVTIEPFDGGWHIADPEIDAVWFGDGTWDSGDSIFRDSSGEPVSPPNLVLAYPLADRAINGVSVPAAGAASLVFPAPVEGKVRDFLVRLTLGEGASVNFPDTVAYETEGGEWPDFSEAGTYVVRLTETEEADATTTPATPARFLMQASAVAEATAGGGE